MAYSFLFGGDTGETPETLKRKRELADAIMGRYSSPRNVGEGLNALGAGIAAGVMRGRANKAEREGRSAAGDLFNRIMGQAPNVSATTMVAPSGGTGGGSTAASAPVDMTGNEIYSAFMGTVDDKIANPYGLAAVAATGKAESGFSPENANRSWSDPSQSGDPGTAGGIMSWRGPRLEALYAYAGSKGEKPGAISPQTQAEFFLQENPELITALNNAKSTEEAQRVINNAWRFAGYDNPGGESARRLGYANALLPSFQGQGQPQEVASLDPSIGMPGSAGEVAATSPRSDAMVTAPNYDPVAAGQPVVPNPGAAVTPLPPPVEVGAPAVPPSAPPMGQPQQVAQSQPDMNTLIQIMTHPFASPEQKAAAQMMYEQQVRQQQSAQGEQLWRQRQQYEQELQNQDPLRQAQIQKAQREAVTGGETFFGNPVPIQNEDGTITYGQMGNRGTFRPIELGEGQSFAPPSRTVNTGTEILQLDQAGNVVSRTPVQNREAAAEKAAGTEEGRTRTERQMAAPAEIQAGENAIALIEDIRKDPGFGRGTGFSSYGNWIPGTAGYDFQNKVEQAKSGAFLTAIQQMRGLGALSNAEGTAATAAINRMDTATSEEAFRAALDDYEKIVRQGIDRARGRVSGADAPLGGGGVDINGYKIRKVQ